MGVCAHTAPLECHAAYRRLFGTFRGPALPLSAKCRQQQSAQLSAHRETRHTSAASNLLAEQVCNKENSSSGNLTHSTEKPASSWAQLPGIPRGYRCRLCFETDFSTRGHLAEHLVSILCQRIDIASCRACSLIKDLVSEGHARAPSVGHNFALCQNAHHAGPGTAD